MLERKKVTDDMLKLAKAVASLRAPVLRERSPPRKPFGWSNSRLRWTSS
jgi:hypothetical protein